ncbi:hypothetical protein K8P94_27365 [Klebsiella pneumoniae]
MKEDIEQAVLEMIKKSGVELGVGELRASSMPSFNTASEHISECAILHSFKEGATHTSVLVWYPQRRLLKCPVRPKACSSGCVSSSRRLRPALGQSRAFWRRMTTKSSFKLLPDGKQGNA